MNFDQYIKDILRHGKCCFSISQAIEVMQKTPKAIYSSIEHWVAKGEIASPAKGFYVIVPPEYQTLGCLPAEYFIPYLLDYWQCAYYVGLLSAAQYHGATHQAVQVFQIIIEGRSRKPIVCGKVKINFIANRNLYKTPTQTFSTAKSLLTLSTPEGTAMDLMNYSHQAGGMNHIATVLSELAEKIQPEKLRLLMESDVALAWKQRLGYLFEILEEPDLVTIIKEHLSKQPRVDYVALIPSIPIVDESKRNAMWKIIENIEIESDL